MLHIGYFATIRELTGKKEENAPDTSDVLTLMLSLCDSYGKNFREFCMTDEGRISKRVNILVNGKHIEHLGKDETPLKDGDDISIFPLIGGG